MGKLLQSISGKKINRRTFLQAGAASVGLGVLGCSSKTDEVFIESEKDMIDAKNAKWIPAACWHNCGGRCVNYALAADGIVLRQKTDDTHVDTPDYPQQRSCLRGRSQQQQCFGADRLKYPMKRKHWAPHGGGRKDLRGKDEWVRISWDEALDLVAEELRYYRETYGGRSIFSPTAYTTFDCTWVSGFLNFCGGFTSVWSTGSQGTFRFSPDAYIGYGVNISNDRFSMKKADTIIFYGCNPAWASGGNPAYLFQQAREAGAKFISVGPFYDTSASVYDAEWVPVRVGTDIAFLLAVAYTMLDEDNPAGNPIIDWDFLDRCTFGFDSAHMPPNPSVDENFRDYVLGAYDGIPKTPAWATQYCGTPVEKIKWFARELRKDIKVSLFHSYSPARQKGAESFPQMLMTIGAMGGHFGKEGHSFSTAYHTGAGNDGFKLVQAGASGMNSFTSAFHVDDCVCTAQIWDTVLTGNYTYTGIGYPFYQFKPAEQRTIDIRMIYHEYGSYLQNFENIHKGIEAHRKVDFVVSHCQFYDAEAMFADIVLPVTTEWERTGAVTFMGASNREVLISHFQVTEPLFEAKDDSWICEQLAIRLGKDPRGLYNISHKQAFFNKLAGATVLKDDGVTREKLLTVTERDIKRWGVDGTPQQGRISMEEYESKGFYQVRRYEGDNFGSIGFKAFRENPDANRRPSTTGKMEIFSDTYANMINNMGHNATDSIKPYPAYRVFIDGYEATFENNNINGSKGQYPFQLFTPHYLRRAHSICDNLPWLRQAMKNPVYLNTADAQTKGINEGDTVMLYNQYGKVLRNATLTERLMPGVIALPHGGWVDLDANEEIDHGGAENCLTTGKTTVSGVSGFNSCLVNFEKYTGPQMTDDYLKPQRIINPIEEA